MDITPDTFKAEVLDSSIPVLVDFWADWCAPCKVLGPQVDRVAKEHADVLKVVKLDAGTHTDFTRELGISGLPTLLVFVEGKEVGRKTGAQGGYAAVKQLVAPHITSA
jgi:thioredoxin 1